MADFWFLLAVLIIGFIVAFAIGGNDEAMAPAVGARIFTVTVAVLIGGVASIIGALTMGQGVSEKVGSDMVGGSPLTPEMVFATLISMAIWLLIASVSKGLPISTTQCIVGSVVGVAIAAPIFGVVGFGFEVISWTVILEIFVGWILSPVIGFIGAAMLFYGIKRLQTRAEGLTGIERQERIAAYALAAFLIFTSLSRGGNDVANAVAPLISMEEFQKTILIGPFVLSGIVVPLLVGGIGMAMGLIVVGRKVIRTLATEVTTLTPMTALAASISVALVMFVGTMWGLPLSGTHVLVAALIAVGWVGQTPIKMKQVKDILISWVITVPISAVFGVIVFAAITALV
ncbi:MAG: inorganic phosphate transporter [Candidatus Thorarchaeota archaeon]